MLLSNIEMIMKTFSLHIIIKQDLRYVILLHSKIHRNLETIIQKRKKKPATFFLVPLCAFRTKTKFDSLELTNSI